MNYFLGLDERLVVARDEVYECFRYGVNGMRPLKADDAIFILFILVSNGNFILKF